MGFPFLLAQGTLELHVNPAAALVTIRGSEFSKTLTNSPGLTMSVPTDEYSIEANSAHWRQRTDVTIFGGSTTPVRIAPNLGTAALTCNQTNASFELFTHDDQLVESGEFPTTIGELPVGNYKLTAEHHQNRLEKNVYVKAGSPSDLQVEFVYGAASLESDPPGATVTSGRKEYGITPLTLSELTPGAFEFSLALSDYETVAGTVAIAAYETNSFRTKLVSRYYIMAMESARRSYVNKAYDRSAESAGEALKHKPDDVEAMNLQRDATGHAHIAQAEELARRGEFTDAIKEANTALSILPNNADAQTLIADYTAREQQRIEQQKKRDAELAEEKKKREEAQATQQQRQQRMNHLNEVFEAISRTYENAPMFASHEFNTTNRLGSVASGINQAMLNIEPKFDVVKFDWPRADTFTLQFRQRIGIGSRQCLIVGVQVSDEETQLRFKVFEYDQPGNISLFGGAVTLSTQITSTSQDPNVIKAKAEQMRRSHAA